MREYKSRQSSAVVDVSRNDLDALSSSSSGVTRRKYQIKIDKKALANKLTIKAQLAQEQANKEDEYWHIPYDFLLRRSMDLGIDTLRKYVAPESQRKLTRREETRPALWHKLSDSAEKSNDSLRLIEF